MRYLIISSEGQSIGLAMKLEREGHACPVYIINNKHQFKGFGFITKILAPRMLRDKDGVYNLSVLDYVLSQAKPEIVIFDTVAPKPVFDHLAKSHVKVFCSDPGLPAIARPLANDAYIAVDGWFNGQEIVGPYGYHLVFSRLMPGSRGIGLIVPTPGVISYFTFYRGAFRDDITAVESQLRSTSYRGPITGYAEIGGSSLSGFHGGLTECTANLFEVLRTPVSQFLVNIANSVPQTVTLSDHHAALIRLTAQLWPAPSPKRPIKLPGLNDQAMKHIWPNDVQSYEGTKFRTTDLGDGDIALISARGGYLREATRRLSRTIENVAGPETQHRYDIVDDAATAKMAEKIFAELLTFEGLSRTLRSSLPKERVA